MKCLLDEVMVYLGKKNRSCRYLTVVIIDAIVNNLHERFGSVIFFLLILKNSSNNKGKTKEI